MTTCFKTMKYNLNDINAFKNSDTIYIVEDKIKSLILSISEKVGAPSYIKTPTFHKKREDKRKKNQKKIWIFQMMIGMPYVIFKSQKKKKRKVLINC